MKSKLVYVLGCAAMTLGLASGVAHSQETEPAKPEHDHGQSAPMDPNMKMEPGMQMEPGMKMDHAVKPHEHATRKPGEPKKSVDSQSVPDANRPITEPTIPPAGDGEAMHMHMHKIEHVMPQLPVIGRSKNPANGTIYKLEDLKARALARNPTLGQAQRDIEVAQGIRRQVGLYPNPTIGYYGDEIRGGAYRSGKEGFFVDQPIITAGKLGLNRKIEDQSIHQMESASEAQRYRVLNATREAYYRVLKAQELLNIKRDLVKISHSTTEYTRELGNTGQADETEILQVEVAEQQMLIAVGVQENMLHRAWVGLASAIGEAQLPMGTVEGDIESLPPDPQDSELLNKLLTLSPAVRYAQAGVQKAEAELTRARREPIPDIVAKSGLSQDNEPLIDPGSRVGLVGFAEIGLQIHVFDRNQGNIDADRAGVQRAQQELTRIELSLRDRSAAVTDEYRNARLIASRYKDEILPRTQRAYTLITTQYGLMDASYSRVLNLQKELYSAEVEYLDALENAQISHVVLDGFLYSGGLDSPGRVDPSMNGAPMENPSAGHMPGMMMPNAFSSPNAQSSIYNSGLQPR